MSTPTRLAVFAAGLVVAFGAAWGVGSAVDPVLDEPAPTPTHQPGPTHDVTSDHDE